MEFTPNLQPRNPSAFYAELEELTKRVYADRKPEDLRHLRKIERWGKGLSLLGYGTAWIGINPFSALAMGLGLSCRWMILAHHVLHKGYDPYAAVPRKYQSANFGNGLCRWIDWCDWIPVKAWVREHNILHHYRLGELYDPDVPEITFKRFTDSPFPQALKYFLVALMAVIWKAGYYGPSTVQAEQRKEKSPPGPFDPFSPATWNPVHPVGRKVWLQSWLPYITLRFGIFPLPSLLLGHSAWLAVLGNTFFAEIFTNLHTFLVIVPNHAGSDIPRFTTPPKDKREHRLRQIVGSVNYRTGGDGNDFLHGWLNYQIEHHLWPDLSLRQYQTWQPALKALCEKHGVVYRQESVWRRLQKLAINVVGDSRMPEIESLVLVPVEITS